MFEGLSLVKKEQLKSIPWTAREEDRWSLLSSLIGTLKQQNLSNKGNLHN